MKGERGIDGYVKSSICYAVAELKKKYQIESTEL